VLVADADVRELLSAQATRRVHIMRRLAVVSGGGTGIGYAVAAAMAVDSDVVILGRRGEILAAAAARINAEHESARVRWLTADLRDPEATDAVAQDIRDGGLDVDVLVNNAGGNFAAHPASGLAELRDQYLENLAGNVLPAVLLTHALLPSLRRPGGRVITVSSIAAMRGNASYGAAKAALHPWAAELAIRLAPEGITVNTVAPGYVGGTEFYRERMNPQFHADRSRQAPIGRGGEPAEVAGLVRYLASAEAGFITGELIHINGGAWLGRG
jgi:3-oxoacyl-[acyl-carrier protein] reductase